MMHRGWRVAGVVVLALTLGACVSMREIDQGIQRAALGRTVDEMQPYWGFPSEERTIAGRQYVLWQAQNISQHWPPPAFGMAWRRGRWSHVWVDQSFPQTIVTECFIQAEVDSDYRILRVEWRGNDCARFARR